MIVRKMRPEEIDSTMICFDYYKSEAIEALPKIADEYDYNSMLGTVRGFASRWDHIWLNAYDGQRVVGFLAGYASESPWNKQLITANVAFVFLQKSHRNMDNFRNMMREFEAWAHQIEATEITAGDIGIHPDENRRIYEHFGFKPILMMSKELVNE